MTVPSTAPVIENDRLLVGDVDLAVQRLGDGPTLLYLHGEDGLALCQPFLAELAKSFTVIAPHHPGWGTSTRPDHIGSVRDLAAVYHEVLEHLGDGVSVAGASLGAWIGAQLGVLRPSQLHRLVLVAPVGIKLGDREERDFVDLYVEPLTRYPGILYGDEAAAPAYAELADDVRLYLATAQEQVARYTWQPYLHDPTLKHWLRRIDVPALVVAGSDDRFVLRPGYFADYARLVGSSGAEIHMIDGGGHRPEEEHPRAVAQRVVAFMTADAGSATPTHEEP